MAANKRAALWNIQIGDRFGDRVLTKRGTFIHFRTRKPLGSTTVGVVCIAHGLGEHFGLYEDIVERLIELNLVVYGSDHHGHGLSEGVRLHMEVYDDYVSDFMSVVYIAERENPGLPIYLIGHSLGGLICISAAAARPDLFKGMALSSPAVGFGVPGFATSILSGIAKVIPKTKLLTIDSKVRSEKRMDIFRNDPLILSHGGITARATAEILRQMPIAQKQASKISIPTLIVHGKEDDVVPMQDTKNFFANLASSDKVFAEIEKGLHDAILEEEGIEGCSFGTVYDWLKVHASSNKL